MPDIGSVENVRHIYLRRQGRRHRNFELDRTRFFAEAGGMADGLYKRLGGYDAIASVADDLLARLTADDQLGRFWKNGGADGVRRERQLPIDFPCTSAGGPLCYTGRATQTSHQGMGISESDWQVFLGHVEASLAIFEVPAAERAEVLAFVGDTKPDNVE